jgi:hypothetical protein
MTNANISTTNSSRRAFLSSAAGIAAGGAVLALATIPPALAATAADPIFALIAAHREAVQGLGDATSALSELEGSLPESVRRSDVFGDQINVVETDNPDWIAANRAWISAIARADDIAAELVSFDEISLAGASALLAYVVEHAEAGHLWPEYVEADDGQGPAEEWGHCLHRALATSLQSLQAAA